MKKVLKVKSKEKYKIYLQYEDGEEGIVDLSILSDRGIFKRWNEEGDFEKVYIDPENGSISWDKERQICPDNLYLQLTGKKPEEIFPSLKETSFHA